MKEKTGTELQNEAMSIFPRSLANRNRWTQGPWEVEEEASGDDNFRNSIYGPGYDGLHIARCNQNGNYLADTYLIRAAPEMYDALIAAQDALFYARTQIDQHDRIESALDLIRKAAAAARGDFK